MFKRNQVEEALARAFSEPGGAPSIDLLTRVKRLLDLDRSLGRKLPSSNPEETNYAFFSEDPPGKGVEVFFSEYEAFALFLGVLLLEHRWPQGFVVATLRRLRTELERQHRRFMKQDPEELFDQEKIRKTAKPGELGFTNTDPVILVIVSAPANKGIGETPIECSVCRGGPKVVEFIRSRQAQSSSMLELVSPAHALAKHLAEVPLRKRGRS